MERSDETGCQPEITGRRKQYIVTDNYIGIMIESLRRKKDVLTDILKLSEEQSILLDDPNLEPDTFEKNVNRKAALIEKLYHAGQPWNVSVIAQACAAAAANEPDWADETAKRIAEERRFLSDGLAACGLTVFPGEANFLLFRSNDTGLHEKLAEHGIMIRNCDNYRGLSAGYYRVAVKTREASERLLQIITNYTQCEV